MRCAKGAPNGWAARPLADVAFLQRGFDITKAEQTDGPYPVISSSGPSSNHAAFKVRGPGVVTGRKGSLGGVYYVATPFWPHDTTLWVKDFHGNDPRFIAYMLKTLNLERFDSGASNPTLNRNHVHGLVVHVPPVTRQREIAAILSAYDDLIENNNRRIKILEEMAQRIYREWFVDFRYPGHEGVPLVDSELGPIPKDWGVVALADLVSHRRTTIKPDEYPNEEFRHFSIPAFDAGATPAIHAGASMRSSKFLVEQESILFSKLNPSTPRAWIATPRETARSVASSEFLVLVPTHPWSITFVFCLLTSAAFAGFVAARAGGTSTSHQRIRPADLLATRVIRPTEPLLERLDAVIGPMLKLRTALITQVPVLGEARDVALPRLVSGDIDVTDLDIAMPEAA